MKTLRIFGLCLAVLVVAGSALAQFGNRGPAPGMRPPQFRGVLNPIVGAGAVYKMTSDTVNGDVELTYLGNENVAGKTGHWIEIGVNSPQAGGQMYMKNLTVVDGTTGTVSRMIMQAPGQSPMEMPAGMFGPTTSSIDVRSNGQLVGTESITTPAGTFSCQHYHGTGPNWDVWIAANVPPWGLVKSKDQYGEMVLDHLITGARDRITGTPQKLEIPGGFAIPRGIPGQ